MDFAIAVDTWEVFIKLRTALINSGEFTDSRIPHRIYLRARSNIEQQIPVDLIPFGGVAEADMVQWPPDRDMVMTVAGFEDAIRASVSVEVRPDLVVAVSSVPGLAVLKLFAWHDRRSTDKDAIDLYRLISNYSDAGNLDRLYGENLGFLEQADYDLDLAGAALLGSDTRQLCSPPTLAKLKKILRVRDFVDMLSERVQQSLWPMQPDQLPRVRSAVSIFIQQILQ